MYVGHAALYYIHPNHSLKARTVAIARRLLLHLTLN